MVRKILFGFFAIILMIFAGCSKSDDNIDNDINFSIEKNDTIISDNDGLINDKYISLENMCEMNRGDWIESTQECEQISKELCERAKGIP